MTKSGVGRSCPFGSSHGKQEIIPYHEESTRIITLFREEGRCSVRAGMMVGERAGWRYLHEGCLCDLLCTESWVKHLLLDLCVEHKQRLGVFSFIQLNITSITGYSVEPHSLIIMQEGSFSLLKVFHGKDLHTSTFLRDRPKCNSRYFHVGESYFTLQTPCHTHTYKAYFYIICFKLCVMTLESELTTEQAT